jgi:hypothetical protein
MNPPADNDRYDRDRDSRRGPDDENAWSRLNGHRWPILNSAVLIAVVTFVANVWADVRQLKDERLSAVSAREVAEIKGQIARLDDKLDRNISDLKRVDEDSRRDRDALHRRIEREHGEHQ